jgi:hypothetical protein
MSQILPWVLLVLAITCSASASVIPTLYRMAGPLGNRLTAASWVLAIAASCVRFE